jgi:hypothetical protein
MSEIRQRATQGLSLAYEARDATGEPLELYRVTAGSE